MNSGENRPPFDISAYVPLGLGAISLFGICLLLVASQLATPRSTVEVPDTATPFQYLFIATEPGISTVETPTEEGISGEGLEPDPLDPFNLTPDLEITNTPRTGFAITAQSGISTSVGNSSNGTQDVSTESTDDPVVIFDGTKKPTLTVGAPLPTRTATLTFVPSPTRTSLAFTKTPIGLQTAAVPTNTVPAGPTRTPTRTPTSAAAAPLNAGTYDDTDARILYNGNWTFQNNVSEAYQNTLHVSTTIGNTITFRFIGQELRLFYQAAPSLGRITITIDQKSFDLEQASDSTVPGSEWLSDFYPAGGTHTVTIEHADGGSVNLDQIVVPDIVPTATPTPR